MYININDINNYCDSDNNNNINNNKALHRHFPKDTCYRSEDNRTPEHNFSEQVFLVYVKPIFVRYRLHSLNFFIPDLKPLKVVNLLALLAQYLKI